LALERRAEESEEWSQPVMEERIRRMTTTLQELVRHLRDWLEDGDEEDRSEIVCEEDEDKFF
jgi:phosphate uptake regulator